MNILIIKLGALGDVVRTLSILPAIKSKFPESEIYWVTKPESSEILENNPYIKKLYTLPFKSEEKFDILYNFDIDKEATELAEKIKADKKYGFYSQDNYPCTFNLSAEYYLNTMFDDELKKSNKKTYQQMIFEAAELNYEKNHCSIYLNDKDKKYAQDFIKANNLENKKILGIHLGASSRWPSKSWHIDNLKEFIKMAKNKGYEILLFAGKNENDKQASLKSHLESEGIKIFYNNPDNTIKEFASLVDICDKIVCSDSLALHISLALKKQTISLFFCTSPEEIEDYGLLKKIVSNMQKDFFPERMDEYSEQLVKSISPEEVLQSL